MKDEFKNFLNRFGKGIKKHRQFAVLTALALAFPQWLGRLGGKFFRRSLMVATIATAIKVKTVAVADKTSDHIPIKFPICSGNNTNIFISFFESECNFTPVKSICQGLKYGSIASVFAIILLFSAFLTPFLTANAQISNTSFMLFEPDTGTPDWLFVANDSSVPVISNLTAVFTNSTTLRVSWKTDVPSTSLVEYATAAQYAGDRYPFPNSVENMTYVTNHAIILKNILPGLKYYYQVRSSRYGILEAVSAVQTIEVRTSPTITPSPQGNNTTATNFVTLQDQSGQSSGLTRQSGRSAELPSEKLTTTSFVSGLVPCGTNRNDGTNHPCGWNDFIKLITNITNYLIILGVAVSALAFGYAGFLMMTAAGEMGKIEEAKAIFGKVIVGLLFMLGAWLIVHTIEAAFITDTTNYKVDPASLNVIKP